VDNQTVSEEKHKPVLDEQTLAKLLEAAYVLQEHNREMRELELHLELKRDQLEAEERSSTPPASQPEGKESTSSNADYTLTLAQIVQTQHQIQVRQLALENALALVAERVLEISRASGAAIGIVDDKSVTYRAVAGGSTLPVGTAVPFDKALCLPCIKTGQVLRCGDVNTEFLLDADECRRRGIQSLIAVPVFHQGGVAGGLELYFASANHFTEQDVHTCQLMAGLITEALARDEENTWKKSLASERAAMLSALEKLQPNLAALVEKPAAKESLANATPSRPHICRKCGHRLVGEEQFCGQCGQPRSSNYEPPTMQSKVASLWQMQEAQKKSAPLEPVEGDAPAELAKEIAAPLEARTPLPTSIEPQIPEILKAPEETTPNAGETELPLELLRIIEEEARSGETEVATETTESAKTESTEEEELGKETSTKLTRRADWSSAASAREFLEQLASAKPAGGFARFWNTRRGDIYLAVAVILVACVIRWGIWTEHPVSATEAPNAAAANHRKADANLSLFDRMLIQLGLAEAPDAPEDKGNPSVQVWVDLHTALYYCPGADLYGKTSKGKFSTQREAQLDQFEPAYRKPCN